MNKNKLKMYMKRMEHETLMKYIGKDNIVSSLVETNLDGSKEISSRDYISEILIALNGEKIFDNAQFRRDMIDVMDEETFAKIQEEEEYLKSGKWGKSEQAKKFLEIFDIDVDEYFKKEIVEKNEAVEEIKLVNERESFYELQDYQYILKKQVMNELERGISQNKILIQMPTGTGKTKTTMHIIVDHMINNLENNGVVLWIADRIELLEQAAESFKNVWQHLGNKNIKVWQVGNEKVITELPDVGIIFITIQQLNKIKGKEIYKQLHKRIRLIVFDEAHKSCAPTYKEIIDNLIEYDEKIGEKNRDLIGLSATPIRENEIESRKLSRMYESNRFTINVDILNQINLSRSEYINLETDNDITRYLQDRKILAKLKVKELEYEPLSEKEKQELLNMIANIKDDEIPKEFIIKIGENKARNIAILREIKRLNEENIPTIVFACSVEHGKQLSAILTANGVENVSVYGDTDRNERRRNIKKYKENKVNILINCDVLTTGFDAKNTKCVLIARPTKSLTLYSQMIGRGLRGPRMGGNEFCELIDVKDNLEQYDDSKAYKYFNQYWRRS